MHKFKIRITPTRFVLGTRAKGYPLVLIGESLARLRGAGLIGTHVDNPTAARTCKRNPGDKKQTCDDKFFHLNYLP